MKFAGIIQGSPMMEFCILGTLADRVEERMKEDFTASWLNTVQVISDDLIPIVPEQSPVYILGSLAIDLASRNSDIDLYIDLYNTTYTQVTTYTTEKNNYSHLYYYLRNHGLNKFFKMRQIISGPWSPVLRLTHLTTGVDLNISVGNGTRVECSTLLRTYVSSDARVRWLMLTIQEWAAQIGVLGTETMFRPDSLTWLLMFFLMRTSPPVVCPVVDLLQEEPLKIVGGWDCSFAPELPKTQNTEQRIDLLVQFLKFVASLDFSTYVISPLTGDLIVKSVFSMPNHLPPCFLPYQLQVINGWIPGLNTSTALCLQDPLDLGHNITQTVDYSVVSRFITKCKDSIAACRLVLHSECAHL